eukprot:g16084.t1
MSALGDWMEKQLPKAQGRLMLNFLDNNDLPRFLYRIGEGGGVPEATMMALYHNALLAMMGMEGLPAILFGSEQNARGRLNYSDPLKACEQSLKVGEGTPLASWLQYIFCNLQAHEEGPLISMSPDPLTPLRVFKVLWVRQRTNGLHAFKCIPVYMDYQVLVWTRGPAIFVVSNAGQPSKIPSQRVLWDNATAGLGPYGTPSMVCNILDENPFQDCGVLVPGNISRLHLTGDPKLYVPKEYITEYVAVLKAKQKEGERIAKEEQHDPVVLPFTKWKAMPEPPVVQIQAQKRVARSWRPGDVTLNGNPSWVWHDFPQLPPHLDKWGPPLGMPVPHVISGVLKDGCFHLGPGEKDGAVFARRANKTYVLCPDSPQYCPRVIDDQAVTARFWRLEELPVLHLTFDVWYGVYHMLISALPSIAPRLDRLRNGTMQLFLHAGHHYVAQVLSVLGVETNVLRPPADPPLKQAFSFCAPEIHFDLSTRPQYPRFEFSVPYLAEFRRNLLATDDWMEEFRPCRAFKRQGHIVVLSRGHSARALGNEDEMVQALKTLGRPVEVVTPDPENFLHTLQTLSRAEVLVGAHGANMANMLFAPDGMKVVEIVPQVPFKMQDYHFWDLAAALNFTYLPIGDKVMPNEYDHQVTSSQLYPEVTLSRTRSPTIWPAERTRDPAEMAQMKRLLPPEPLESAAGRLVPPAANGRPGSGQRDPPGASAKSVARVPRDWESQSSDDEKRHPQRGVGPGGLPERSLDRSALERQEQAELDVAAKRSGYGSKWCKHCQLLFFFSFWGVERLVHTRNQHFGPRSRSSRSRSRDGLNGRDKEEARSVPSDAEEVEVWRPAWRRSVSARKERCQAAFVR